MDENMNSEKLSAIEKTVIDLANLLGIKGNVLQIVQTLQTELQKIYTSETHAPAAESAPQAADAKGYLPAENSQTSDSAQLVPLTKSELESLTGCSVKALTKYIEEGVKPVEILEMFHLASMHDSSIPHIKQRLLDQGVRVDDMDSILEARDEFYTERAPVAGRRDLFGLSLSTLVHVYHSLNDDIDEFNQLIQTASEYERLAIIHVRGGDVRKINPNTFLNKILHVYLHEGERDITLTMDILEKRMGKNHSEELSFAYDRDARKEDHEDGGFPDDDSEYELPTDGPEC